MGIFSDKDNNDLHTADGGNRVKVVYFDRKEEIFEVEEWSTDDDGNFAFTLPDGRDLVLNERFVIAVMDL